MRGIQNQRLRKGRGDEKQIVMKIINDFIEWLHLTWMSFSVIGEVALALVARKKFWLLPVVLLIILIGVVLVVAQGTALSPIIYGLL